MGENVQFCTFGMFIIDEIEYLDGRTRQKNVMGGAGTYAALGARLVAGMSNAGGVGWIVDVGSDFPAEMRNTLQSWNTSCVFREDKSRLTTRAWNGYGPDEYRAFKYLTPKLRLDEKSLSLDQIMAKAFHMVCSPLRCMELVQGVTSRRESTASNAERVSQGLRDRPVTIWEPIPDLCTPAELDRLREAVKNVDVLSPNGEELAGFFPDRGGAYSQEQMANEILGWVSWNAESTLVVREGSKGCSAYSRALHINLRAYHQVQKDQESRVVDPTGGGNTFLGALAMAMGGIVYPAAHFVENELISSASELCLTKTWKNSGNMVCALIYATVAASFAIEQTGMPLLSSSGSWNGEFFSDRLVAYVKREKQHIRNQMRCA